MFAGKGFEELKDKLKTIYVCGNCGETAPRWLGRCPSCNQWNTMVEDVVAEPKAARAAGRQLPLPSGVQSVPLCDVALDEQEERLYTGVPELDRVLGGGIVKGSVVLLGGEPGAGKSTLLLQLCAALAGQAVALYVTGEESVRQIKLRADRLGLPQGNISVIAENDVDTIERLITQTRPGFVVIDSIQTMNTAELASSSGSVSQVKEGASRFLRLAKEQEIPIFIVGHVNKDGAIAGPKVMEHIVDTVLYFEGDRTLPYRILRAVKNRYGSTNEIGMFDMGPKGLVAIDNPSELFLAGKPEGVSGNCVGCLIEGTRPIMVEIQALATKTGFGTPRRATIGVDGGRVNLLLAIIEKRAGFILGNLDVYINVVGGIQLSETSCDLPVCLAVISSILDQVVPDDLIAIGEVGLGGELRSVSNVEQRLKEAQRIGFKRAILPKVNVANLNRGDYPGLEITGAAYVRDCLSVFQIAGEV